MKMVIFQVRKSVIMKLVLLSCLIAFVAASDVVELTDADFESDIGKYDTALVEFFAPWCGHCKRLAPEYEKAATTLKNDDVDVALVKVDCIANTGTCGKFSVSGYPTLKIFRGGELSTDYNGPREADGIVKYMKKQVEPASRNLDTQETYDKFIARDDPVVVGYFEDSESADAKAYAAAASTLREDYSFGHTYDADIIEKAGQKGVVLHRPLRLKSKFEDQTVTLSGAVTSSSIKSFLTENFFGLCGVMTQGNAGNFKKPIATAYYNVDYVKNPKGTNYWRNRVMKVGKDYQDKLTFSIANADDFNSLLSDVGRGDHGDSPVVVIQDESSRKYVMQDDFNMDTFRAFLESYLAGEIKPKIKSEAVPESQDGPVTVVVGETFDKIVMDESKDVLIEFYAPWCGHCKSLAPKWDELGEKLKENEDLVIAKIDATANDSPAQFAVSGFPTIYWAPKGNKQNPTKYSGGREVSDFVSFLEREASTKLKKTEL